jgi:NAD(P)-dependent dehydrogenase (short-subunit alcohol dehydrogenase family)
MTQTSLAGRRILMGGGTGDVGVEVVASLLSAGAEVVALVRSRARADDLGHHEKLIIIEGFPDTDADVAAITREIGLLGPLHGAIASLGPWFHGPRLAELPLADWDRMLKASLTSHYLFARVAIPNLVDGGHYLMINGGAALGPVPSSGIVSIAASAQAMMARVLAAEHPSLRIHTLMLLTIIATRAREVWDPSWVTAKEVGETCVRLLGSEVGIPGKVPGTVYETTLSARSEQ